MTRNLVILHIVFITTEQFGYIETQITHTHKNSTYFIEIFKNTFLKAFKLYLRRKSASRTTSKGDFFTSICEKIILASTVFYLWIIIFKIAYFEHPSEGKI